VTVATLFAYKMLVYIAKLTVVHAGLNREGGGAEKKCVSEKKTFDITCRISLFIDFE